MEVIATIKHRKNEDFSFKVERLYRLGIRKFRMNYAKVDSVSSMESFFSDIETVRRIGHDTEIIVDIPYPGRKIRFLYPRGSVQVNTGDVYQLHFSKISQVYACNENYLYITDQAIDNFISPGMKIYYDSGEGAFIVTNIKVGEYVELKAINSFKMYSNKSLSYGSRIVSDYTNIVEIICGRVTPNAIAFSFVECGNELVRARELKEKYGFRIISKIESQKGIDNLDDIIIKSDEIMIGRGDLGLNVDVCDLFLLQKSIVERCKKKETKCHIATGFMNSCINNVVPSRSDIMDVSFAIGLAPDSLVLNVDLAMSDGIITAIEDIQKISNRLISGKWCSL